MRASNQIWNYGSNTVYRPFENGKKYKINHSKLNSCHNTDFEMKPDIEYCYTDSSCPQKNKVD